MTTTTIYFDGTSNILADHIPDDSISTKVPPQLCHIIISHIYIVLKNRCCGNVSGNVYQRYCWNKWNRVCEISWQAEKSHVPLRHISDLLIRYSIFVTDDVGGDYSPVYSHLKTGHRGLIVIVAIEESAPDLVGLIWRHLKAVTVLGARIRKVSKGCEFGKVWIIFGGTGDVCVHTRVFVNKLIVRHPCYSGNLIHITGCWTTVHEERSCRHRKSLDS